MTNLPPCWGGSITNRLVLRALADLLKPHLPRGGDKAIANAEAVFISVLSRRPRKPRRRRKPKPVRAGLTARDVPFDAFGGRAL